MGIAVVAPIEVKPGKIKDLKIPPSIEKRISSVPLKDWYLLKGSLGTVFMATSGREQLLIGSLRDGPALFQAAYDLDKKELINFVQAGSTSTVLNNLLTSILHERVKVPFADAPAFLPLIMDKRGIFS